MIRLNGPLSFVCALALAASSCGEKKDESGGEAETAKVPASGKSTDKETAKPVPKTPDAPAKIDDALMGELKKIAELCDVNVSGVTVTNCPNKEARTLTDSFRERDRGAAVDTFAAALAGADDKVKTVAANLSRSALSNFGIGAKAAKVDSVAAKRYIAAVGKLEKYHAAQAIRSAVHAAMLGGATDELYALLDTHDYLPARAMGYREVMTHGRTSVLPKLKDLAKGDDVNVAAAAVSAARLMYKATAEEKAATCPWIVEYLGSARAKIYMEAGHSAVWCGGEYVDALLDEGEKRLAANQFDRDSYLVFRDICFTPIGNKVKGTPEQCDRNYKFLESAVKNEKVDETARGLALFAIYYQRRDAKTMKVVKKYRNSKVPKIREYANKAIKSLKETYKVK